MKFKKAIQLGAVIATFALAVNSLQATSGTWATNSNGDWDTGANWLGGVPNGVGELAVITYQAGGGRTVTLNTTRTVGVLTLARGGGVITSTRQWYIRGSGTLYLDNGASKPIVRTLNGHADTIEVPLAGVNGVQFNDAGLLGLNAANTYTGDTWVDRGTTYLLNASALPNTSVLGRSGNIIFTSNQSPGNWGALDLYGNNIQINGLSSAVSPSGGGGTITTTSGNVTLTLGDGNQDGNFRGVIQNGGGTINLTKIGTGTQVLAGANTYTGNTTVSDGELNLADDAQLKFKIGNTGTAGDLTVNNWITGSGTLSLDGDFNFDVTGAALVENNMWNIVDTANVGESYGGTFSVVGATLDSGVWKWQSGDWYWSYDPSTSILSVVPEPSALVLGLLGGIGTLVFLRRRRLV